MILLSQFKGPLTSMFSAKKDNVFLDLESCSGNLFEYTSCYGWSYMVGGKNEEMDGSQYLKTITSEFEMPRYVFKGWIMLKLST